MAELLRPDLCVIGAGSGGLSVAAAAAAFGVPVVLVEQARMGGECLNTGCVPSKALLAAGERARTMRESGEFGVEAGRIRVDFAAVRRHIRQAISAIAPNDSAERFTGLGVRVIHGAARFIDRETVAVGAEFLIKARRFVLATGSAPAIPAIPGLDQVPYLTNATIFDLAVRPKHLLVIGAGPIGLELAQAFQRLGSRVTVLEAGRPLAKDDPECAAVVLAQLQREGVVVRAGVRIARVKRGRGKIQLILQGDGEETIEGDQLLLAAGRQPNVDNLDLPAAGIAYGPRGVMVDKRLRTKNKKVYAVGDVGGGPQFTHVANYQAGLVIRHALFRLPVRANDAAIPWVTFTDPELAHVGLTQAQARERHRAVRVLRWPYHENDRAQTERATKGHIKVVTSKGGKILGATIVGAAAGELITTWTLAIARGLNIRAMAAIVVPYPTLAEIGKRAAITYFIPGLTSPFVRRIIGLLRRLG
jgi:pyruvate/2-oxoglutarate dehydrogenase complex dihydrolipoamide dehydrogenase (E3) component